MVVRRSGPLARAAGADSGGAGFGYQVLMSVLCLYAILSLLMAMVLPLSTQVVQLLQYVDFAVCVFFFCDFLFLLHRAENRWRYFYTWGWLDLLSSIPAVDVFRVARLARILRILRVLRALKAARMLGALFFADRSRSALLSAAAVTVVTLILCSVAVLGFEQEAGGNIATAEDALWWALSTVTTVGYGDRFPVTAEGRAVAVVLMTAGIGFFGVLSGALAAWFLTPSATEDSGHLARLQEQVAALEAENARLRSRAAGDASQGSA